MQQRLRVFAAACAVTIGTATGAAGQAARAVTAEADLLKEPGGIQLLHVSKGTTLAVGAAKSGGFAATIEGWIPENALHDDKRDGFDISVSLPAGTTLRDRAGGNPRASARLGALFDKVETRGGWVHVKRTGWIAASAFAAAPVAKPPAPPPAPPPATPPATPPAPTQRPPASTTTAPLATVAAGSPLMSVPGGPPVATFEAPVHATVVERRGGYSHVQIDGWVKDAAVGTTTASTGITAAEIRAAPDKYVGQTVEWSLQILGIQKADELRPELPAGQPYLLARGPLPETGFVYVSVTNDEAETFRKLEPLATVKIRATVRAGRSRFLPTPVLNFVRRLD